MPKIPPDRNKPTPQYITDALARFGKNPWGENRYRIVWSETRSQMTGGRWNTGYEGYHHTPVFGSVQRWVVERWEPCRMTKKQWQEQTRLTMDTEGQPITRAIYECGPYPVRGIWKDLLIIQHRDTKAYMPLSPLLASRLVTLIEKDLRMTTWQKKREKEELQQKRDARRSAQIADMAADVISAFLNDPYSGSHGHSKGKDQRQTSIYMPPPGFRQRHIN